MNSLLSPDRVKEIKEMANAVLADSPGNDPYQRITHIAEKNGIKILQSDLYEMSGALRKEGEDWVIYVNKSDSSQRKLFTIAHELGHFFVHKKERDEFIDGQLISRNEQEKNAAIELEANEFAGNLIMPEQEIKQKIPAAITEETIQELARSFNVSTLAMETRLKNLGYGNLFEKQRQ